MTDLVIRTVNGKREYALDHCDGRTRINWREERRIPLPAHLVNVPLVMLIRAYEAAVGDVHVEVH